MNKPEMRAAMNAFLRRLSPDDVARRSAMVAGRLFSTGQWRTADAVLTFLSMPREIDTATLVAAARAAGRTVAVPLMEAGEIRFVVLPRDTVDMPRDRWGIPVPGPGWARFDLAVAARPLVTAPGLAFDGRGNRLGRGKGYYDRFLARARAAAPGLAVLGICFAEQLVDEVPHGPSDVRVDGVVTEEGVVTAREPGSA